MRPKIFAVLAVASLALAGCSAAETEPTPTVTVTATPEAETTPTASADPEEAFLEAVESTTAPHEEYFDELPASVKSEEYWLEVGKEKCADLEAGSLKVASNTGDPLEDEYQGLIMRAAIPNLCPPETD